ncbi:MAG: flagellin, partial [Candidatus Verstraetearchaeota archaeon]|nr:flagellin [Candidatus Verstraetearchaeota archaeon]
MRRGRRALKRRGVVGIESAIVLIAFVIVAAALAFVVLNMGFFTTQKSKETIRSGLGEASSALELDGSIVAHVDTTNKKVTYWYAPL